MAKAKTTASAKKPRDTNGKDRKAESRAPEKPPESAEDFAHVLRRLVSARNGRAGRT